MPSWIRALPLVALLVASATSAHAATGMISPEGMTAQEVATWLKGAGYKADLKTDSSGRPTIQSQIGEISFDVYLYDCEANRCKSIQFTAGFDLTAPVAISRVNDWNRDNRYLKSFVDSKGDAYVQYDVNVNAGRTYSGLDDDFSVWTAFVGDFAAFIGW